MRFEGLTLSRAVGPSDLIIEGVIGRGACSVVQKARMVSRGGGAGANDENSAAGEVGVEGRTLALKVFPMRDRARKEMLTKELRALAGFRCECLVGLVGAFFDAEDRTVTMVSERGLRTTTHLHRASWGGVSIAVVRPGRMY